MHIHGTYMEIHESINVYTVERTLKENPKFVKITVNINIFVLFNVRARSSKRHFACLASY